MFNTQLFANEVTHKLVDIVEELTEKSGPDNVKQLIVLAAGLTHLHGEDDREYSFVGFMESYFKERNVTLGRTLKR